VINTVTVSALQNFHMEMPHPSRAVGPARSNAIVMRRVFIQVDANALGYIMVMV
jgi:hypothetical protein